MRYFSLINNSGETLDITTKTIFFNGVSGLGFEEEASFRSVGSMWWLNYASVRQKPVSGKIIFTDYEDSDPYELYAEFTRFIREAPLELEYMPRGLDGPAYYRRVRVTKLTKSELTQYGVLEEDIEFTPYTPWYETLYLRNAVTEDEYTGEWIWGDGGEHPDVMFVPAPEGTTPTIFGADDKYVISADVPYCDESPSRLIIYGPAVNPSWTHYVNGEAISGGGFTQNVSIGDDEALVIDNTTEITEIAVYAVNQNDEEKLALADFRRDLYQIRNFDNECFVTLQAGSNRVVVASSDGAPLKLSLEGHIYNATV